MDARDFAPWFQRRLRLRRDMMRRLGLRLRRTLTLTEQGEVRETLIRCAECSVTEACENWVRQIPRADEAPHFCPNRQLFQGLAA